MLGATLSMEFSDHALSHGIACAWRKLCTIRQQLRNPNCFLCLRLRLLNSIVAPSLLWGGQTWRFIARAARPWLYQSRALNCAAIDCAEVKTKRDHWITIDAALNMYDCCEDLTAVALDHQDPTRDACLVRASLAGTKSMQKHVFLESLLQWKAQQYLIFRHPRRFFPWRWEQQFHLAGVGESIPDWEGSASRESRRDASWRERGMIWTEQVLLRWCTTGLRLSLIRVP